MTLIVFLVIQTNIILFQFGMGIGISANIRIGHYLGGNNPIGAKSAYRTALTMICKSENAFFVRPKHRHSCCNTTNPILLNEINETISVGDTAGGGLDQIFIWRGGILGYLNSKYQVLTKLSFSVWEGGILDTTFN